MHATEKDSQLSWIAVIAAGAAAQLVLGVMLAQGPLPGLNVDDALHALAGGATWHDLVRLDLRSFYLDVYDQARWPPLGGFLLWPALAVFGPAEATYRLGILMWLVACVAAWVVVARAATEEFLSAAWAGVILVPLALSSQIVLVTSASVLCEIPGLAFMLGAYAAAHAAWQHRRPRWFWLGGLLLAASWFTKWQYGIVATAALLFVLAHQRRLSGKAQGEIWLFLPSVVLVALWLASPYHLREMLMYLLWKPASAEKLRSYGAEFLRAVADAPLITKANLVATVVGLVLVTRLSRRPVALALFAHLVIAALGSGLKDLSPRTGLWIAVPAWVLAAAGWGRLLGVKVSPRAGRPVLAMLGVLAIAVATHTALKVSREFRFWGASATDWHRPAARFIAAEVPLGARLLTVGAWSEFISPYHIKLEVLSQNWHRRFA
ncbi:MAG: glycosyltransferase family 39 protein, partial [Armatimonadetes bacterium]|nr:glycosyltransferase family 39 protein [Armatimonadota bacterium]